MEKKVGRGRFVLAMRMSEKTVKTASLKSSLQLLVPLYDFY